MSRVCAVYHWWDEHGDSPPYANLRIPAIISIATLRATNPDIPILVLDITKETRDWGEFPDKLGFSVKKIKPNLSGFKNHIKGWKHLSRFTDIHNTAIPFTDTVMYVDSDVFWLTDPLPLACSPERFCFDGWNTGFYYYNKNATFAEEFFDAFEAYTKAAIYSQDVRQIMKQYVQYESWHGVWDEMIATYMINHHREWFNVVPMDEHVAARKLHLSKSPKMFHCNGTMVSNQVPKTPNEKAHCRGLLGILVTELYENLRKVLNSEELETIYSVQELKTYLPQQFPLRRILETKAEDGHFYAEKCLAPRKLLI